MMKTTSPIDASQVNYVAEEQVRQVWCRHGGAGAGEDVA